MSATKGPAVQYQMINTPDELLAALADLDEVPYLVVDTEFVRTRTFYSQLGLFQLYDGRSLWLIDPLTCGDLEPLWKALLPRPLVIHACSEDLELIRHLSGRSPACLYDTQIAAAFLGYPLSIGYRQLIQDYLGIEVDKGEARTNWLARPLSERQLDYAAKDVFYLYPVFEQLQQQLHEQGWWQAFNEECASLIAEKEKPVDPERAYLDIKNAWQLRPRALGLLQLLASWRLKTAMARDMAVNFVVKEASLWQIARHFPRSFDELRELGLQPMEIKHHGKALLAMVQQAKKQDEAALPFPIRRLIEHPDYKTALKLIREQVAQAQQQTGLPAELIASKKMIHQYLHWCWRLDECQREASGKPKLLSGWRHELLGLDARVS